MITKEMIMKGFENGIISIENYSDCCDNICCCIGGNSFYFVGMEDENLSAEEYLESYSIAEIINMLYEILKDVESAEDSGLDIEEWEYYKAILL